jgi:superfamily I DNA and/or RNA helicase
MLLGNEDDHIIISAVRTKKVGFLQNLRRNNVRLSFFIVLPTYQSFVPSQVMLTRCKKSMVICTNRTFLTTNKSAQKTLLGKMAATWGAAGWISWTQLLAGHF